MVGLEFFTIFFGIVAVVAFVVAAALQRDSIDSSRRMNDKDRVISELSGDLLAMEEYIEAMRNELQYLNNKESKAYSRKTRMELDE